MTIQLDQPASPLRELPLSRKRPYRILFVFAWLVVGGEETEVRLLARHLDPKRYQLEVVACFRKPNMPEQTHEQLAALGVQVDKRPYELSFEDTISYLAEKMAHYDLVVACQAVPDVYPALERMASRPPLIEHGGLVSEALHGPKHFTTRYVGVCHTICEAARLRMLTRGEHVLEIPSMVDLSEFDSAARAAVRAEWQVDEQTPVVGWVGRLDRKKCVEDFIQAAALVIKRYPQSRFFIIGGADAFMPEYADALQDLAQQLGLQEALYFLGDRADVPRLLAGLDMFVWLSRGEGMPHVISEAGAARLPVIATADNGVLEQITHGENGLFVPYHSPAAVAAAIGQCIENPALREQLGSNLRAKVEQVFSAQVVVRQWEDLFEQVITEHLRSTQRSSP